MLPRRRKLFHEKKKLLLQIRSAKHLIKTLGSDTVCSILRERRQKCEGIEEERVDPKVKEAHFGKGEERRLSEAKDGINGRKDGIRLRCSERMKREERKKWRERQMSGTLERKK